MITSEQELEMNTIRDERLSLIKSHMPESNDLTLLTLKGHLLAEEILNDIIAVYCKSPEVFFQSNIGFKHKITLIHSLLGDILFSVEQIKMLQSLNALRNEFAHNLTSDKIEQKITRFINGTNSKISKKEESHKQFLGALHYMFGHICATEAWVKVIIQPNTRHGK